jgi:hypothetical protein
MNHRGLRVTLIAGAIGLAVVAIVVAFNWDVVRDHVEAWWFVATRQTVTITSDPTLPGLAIDGRKLFYERSEPKVWDCLQIVAKYSGCPVIADKETVDLWFGVRSADYRILEQRFPRRAYVVVGYPERDKVEPVLWDGE